MRSAVISIRVPRHHQTITIHVSSQIAALHVIVVIDPEEMHKLDRLVLLSRYGVEGNLAGAHHEIASSVRRRALIIVISDLLAVLKKEGAV
jgi:hypothetical protein